MPEFPGQGLNGLELAARYAAAADGSVPAAELADAVATNPDARVRAAALAAVVRGGGRRPARAVWTLAVIDPDAAVRRRATEIAPALDPPPVTGLLTLLADTDPLVAESAAWALGEVTWTGRTRSRVVRALASVATGHPDPLVRESAVAGLGAVGDDAGLAAILHACADRPAIRRRAVLALAPFSGDDVDAAIARALADPDWQVRQAAEDLST